MATPHIAGIAALIKQKYPEWSPAAIVSAANVTDHLRAPILARPPFSLGAPIIPQQSYRLVPATPFDLGSGAINPARALDPGLVFDIKFMDYIQFLCAVPGVDDNSIRQARGIEYPTKEAWCSNLNTESITVSKLVRSRMVDWRVTNVYSEKEKYQVMLKEPMGVAVTVSPMVFEISPNASRDLKIHLEAKEATNDYTFGELVLEGSKNHVVRVPLAVYVSSAIGP